MEYLATKVVADITGVGSRLLHKWCMDGLIEYQRDSNGRYFISTDSISHVRRLASDHREKYHPSRYGRQPVRVKAGKTSLPQRHNTFYKHQKQDYGSRCFICNEIVYDAPDYGPLVLWKCRRCCNKDKKTVGTTSIAMMEPGYGYPKKGRVNKK